LAEGWQPEQVRASELLEPVEPCDHVLGCGDLQGGWPLSQRLAAARSSRQPVLQLRDMAAECDSRPVCCHIQRVHHLAVKILDGALHFQRRLLGRAAVRFDQMPRAGDVVGDLR
jgi:hypothetical protein